MTRGMAAARALLLFAAALGGCQRADTGETWEREPVSPELSGWAVVRDAELSLEELRGSVVLVAFGYTSCTDICPTTLSRFRAVLRELGDQGVHLRPLYVSVDPERDTPQRVRSFLTVYDPRIEGLVVPADQLPRALEGFGAVAERQPAPVSRYMRGGSVEDAQSDYAIDHTTTLYVIDPAGRLRIRYSTRASRELIGAGILALLRQEGR
jgi:protein SCO1/2